MNQWPDFVSIVKRSLHLACTKYKGNSKKTKSSSRTKLDLTNCRLQQIKYALQAIVCIRGTCRNCRENTCSNILQSIYSYKLPISQNSTAHRDQLYELTVRKTACYNILNDFSIFNIKICKQEVTLYAHVLSSIICRLMYYVIDICFSQVKLKRRGYLLNSCSII